MKSFLLLAFLLSAQAAGAAGSPERRTILFFGDSLTAGYGVETSEAYPALIQKEIDDLGWPFQTVNAGLSGDTTSAAAQRLRWLLRRKVHVLVLALGGNDGLRGVPPEAMERNLQSLVDQAKKKDPAIRLVLAGVKMPPNYGPDYTARFAAVFPRLAEKNGLPFIPFILEGVGGDPNLNLPDRIHPNPEGHRIIARTVWKALKPVLEKELKRDREEADKASYPTRTLP